MKKLQKTDICIVSAVVALCLATLFPIGCSRHKTEESVASLPLTATATKIDSHKADSEPAIIAAALITDTARPVIPQKKPEPEPEIVVPEPEPIVQEPEPEPEPEPVIPEPEPQDSVSAEPVAQQSEVKVEPSLRDISAGAVAVKPPEPKPEPPAQPQEPPKAEPVVEQPKPAPVEEPKKPEPEPEPVAKVDDEEYKRSVGDSAVNVTKETFEEDKKVILSIIEQLDTVMKNTDYKTWLTFVDEESIRYWSQKSNLQKAASQLPVRGLRLNTLEDYFRYVFIGARKGRQVDEIRYITDSQVKAVQVNGTNDTVYYNFKKSNGRWKLHLPPI